MYGLPNAHVSPLTKSSSLLWQFTRVTTCQLDVSVHDIKNALAYAIHEFLVTIRDYGLTQYRFRRTEYVKGVLIRFH